jgi:PHD/YefM family antitoxin component YafN of YafNO toxin-antitoxin module
MVVMSLAHYERLQSMLELYHKLGEAESLDASGEKGITHEELFRRLKARIK